MSMLQVNNVRLIPSTEVGSLSCSQDKIVWNGRHSILLSSIEATFIDKISLTLLLTVRNEGFKLFQLESSDHITQLQNWIQYCRQLKLEQDSSAYASFVNPSLRNTRDATLDVFEAFAQIPKRLTELFSNENNATRPRRQQQTIPTNPWINERPLHLGSSQMTPGSSLAIELADIDFLKCSLLVYNSGGSILKSHSWYWQKWADEKEQILPKTDSIAEEFIGRIEKDLPRLGTNDAAMTERTRGLLLLAARCFPEIGYVQGMADLALPFAPESSTHAFLLFLNQFKENFSEDSSSMMAQLEALYSNIQEMSPVLADWLSFNRDCRALLFAYRWLLVLLRREFSSKDVDRLWSVMIAAESVKNVSMRSYLLTFCTAMILSSKQSLQEECVRFEDVIKVRNCGFSKF